MIEKVKTLNEHYISWSSQIVHFNSEIEQTYQEVGGTKNVSSLVK